MLQFLNLNLFLILGFHLFFVFPPVQSGLKCVVAALTVTPAAEFQARRRYRLLGLVSFTITFSASVSGVRIDSARNVEISKVAEQRICRSLRRG